MNDLIVLMFFGAALIACVVWLWRRQAGRVRAARNTIHHALVTCRLLLEVLKLLQQHRGLSSGWLAGNKEFGPRMLARRREIDALLPRLSQALKLEHDLPSACVSINALRVFKHRWGELVAGLEAASVEQNIAEHSFLISDVLDWLSALGEARIALCVPDHVPMSLGRNFAQRLPALSEFLGQARAIGSSVAARQRCSPVARVRLLFLVARAEAILAQSWDGAAHNPAERRSADVARRAVNEMTTLVRTQLLLSRGVAVTADAFFQVATRAIDEVFGWIDTCGRDLESRLAEGVYRPSDRREAFVAISP